MSTPQEYFDSLLIQTPLQRAQADVAAKRARLDEKLAASKQLDAQAQSAASDYFDNLLKPTAAHEAVMRDTGVDYPTADKTVKSGALRNVSHLPPAVPTAAVPENTARLYQFLRENKPQQAAPRPPVDMTTSISSVTGKAVRKPVVPAGITHNTVDRVIESVYENSPIPAAIESLKAGLAGGPIAQIRHGIEVARGMGEAQLSEYRKARELSKQKGYKDPRAALADPDVARHFLAAIVPVVGPMAEHGIQQVEQGDIAGAVGTFGTLLLPAVPKVARGLKGRFVKAAETAAEVKPLAAEEATNARQTPPIQRETGPAGEAYRPVDAEVPPIDVAEQGKVGGIRERPEAKVQPQAVTSSPNLTRNFRAGTNDATLTFASEIQRDLYDLAAKERNPSRGSRGVNLSPVDQEAMVTQRAMLAERLGLTGAEISAKARAVHDDVKAQMKGVKHLEERTVVDNILGESDAQIPVPEAVRREGAAGAKAPITEGQVSEAASRPEAPAKTQEVGTRAFQETAVEAGFTKGRELTYEIMHREDARAAAEQFVADKGVDTAVEIVKASEPSGETTARGIVILDHLRAAGDDAGVAAMVDALSEKLYRGGQSSAMVQIIDEYAPGRVLINAQKQKGAPLTPKQVKAFTESADQIAATKEAVTKSEAHLDAVSAKLPATSPANWRAKLIDAEAAARERIAARRQGGAGEAGFIGEKAAGKEGLAGGTGDIADYAIVGAAKLARKGIDFATWAKEMSAEFGDSIKPHLAAIYRASFERYSTAKRDAYQAMKERVVQKGLPPMTAQELATAVAQRDLAIKQRTAATRGLASEFRHLQPLRLQLANISGIRKAGMLLSPKTWGRNIGGNTVFQIEEEIARAPAAVADTAMSLVTHQRSISGPNPIALLDSAIASFKKRGELGEIMRHGATAEQMKQMQFHHEIDTGIKVVDVASNAVFRFMAAQDRAFYNAALERNLLDRTRIAAKNEGAANVKARAAELKANPPAELEAAAEHDALVATFNNNNAFSDAIQRGRSALSPAANLAVDMVLPFDRTPTNIVARVLEATPLGYGKNAAQIARAVIHKSLSVEEQRAIAQTFGRATTGTGIMLLGYKLAMEGVLTGPASSDANERAKQEAGGRPPLSLKTPAGWVEIGRLSPPGNLLTMGAGLYEEIQRKAGLFTAARRSLGKTILEQPTLGATSQVRDIVGPEENKFERAVAGTATSLIPGSALVRDIAQKTDASERRYPRDIVERIKMNVPGLRKQVPSLPPAEKIKEMSMAEAGAAYRKASGADKLVLRRRMSELLSRLEQAARNPDAKPETRQRAREARRIFNEAVQ